LVVGQLAGLRNGTGWFKAPEVAQLFEDFRVPHERRNTTRDLGNLRRRGWTIKRERDKAWALTPEGRERVQELVGEVALAELQPELVYAPGVEFGHALHTLLPPSLAPVKWAAPIKRLLERFPFEQNVFCMTRFPDDDEDTAYLDPVEDVITTARDALGHHGLTLHVASDRLIEDDLLANVAGYMWACEYGIGLFEDRLGRDLNKNLIIEVGSMLMTGRRCALLKDRTAPQMPTDFIGQIYKPVDFDDLAGVAETLHLWAAEDLGLGRCASCPTD
jgi:hypothetical protein